MRRNREAGIARRDDRPPAILLGGEVTALAAARSLGSAGVQVYSLGGRWDPVRRSRFCNEFVDLGTGNHLQERSLEWLTGAPAGAVVLPCSDDGVELVARHRSSLLEFGLVTVEADDRVLLAMLDKERTHQLAADAGIPVPRTLLVRNRDDLDRAAEEIAYPCALKPVHSHLFRRHSAGKGFIAQNSSALDDAFSRTQALGVDVVLTELVPGSDDRYQSCYTYLDENGEPLYLFTKRKLRQYPIRFGGGCYHVTNSDPELAELALRFFRAVGIRGLGNAEFKQDARDGRLKLIECNPRFTEATALLRAAGVDLPLFTYNRLIGCPPPPVDAYRVGLAMWYPVNDFRAFISYRRRGELTFGRWASSLLRPQHFPIASRRDPMPIVVAVGRRAANVRRKLSQLIGRR
jgi:D-aspartate ligase